MTNFRKLFLWILICILTLCALRYGVLESANQYIYNLRNTHIPSFAYRYDDFLPYLPLTIMFGLKIAGIKSRSNWTQMLVATVFSFALMVITVSSIKSLAGVLRPDGSDLLSFPSGHTGNLLLHQQFVVQGIWQESILVSVVAYLPAVVTGITRQLNNRHWLSDVVGGAVIGIVAVEAGYFFTDLLFKKKQN